MLQAHSQSGRDGTLNVRVLPGHAVRVAGVIGEEVAREGTLIEDLDALDALALIAQGVAEGVR